MSKTAQPNLVQSLSQGISALKVITASQHPLSAADISQRVNVSKATGHRLLRTLEHHDLVSKTPDGRYVTGPGIRPLAAATHRTFRQLTAPALRTLADSTGLTALIAVQDGDDCVTILSSTPAGLTTSIAQAPGTRHPISAGAPGKAILSITPHSDWPSMEPSETAALESEIEATWQRGYAVSQDEVLVGVSSIAVPFQLPGEPACALALLCADQSRDATKLADELRRTTLEIESRV